jgi:hypothetical protein
MRNTSRTFIALLTTLALAACSGSDETSAQGPSSPSTGGEGPGGKADDWGNASPTQKVASVVKSHLAGWTAEQGVASMHHHLTRMHLMNADGTWASPELQKQADFLAPALSKQQILQFVDEMAKAAEQNKYLGAFLEKVSLGDFQVLSEKLETEGDVVLPSAAAYAVVLERLTVLMHDDWHFIDVCKTIWKKARRDTAALKYADAFHVAKILSVEVPVDKFVTFHRNQSVDPGFAGVLLPLNISEATLVDLRAGQRDNARAGWTLMLNRPGTPEYNPLTEAGPSHFSDDGKGIHVGLPLAEKWADLYSTWNMAFVSRYGYFPFVVGKLLVPQVAAYHDDPQEYLYNRVLALYAHENWLLLGVAEEARTGEPSDESSVQWSDPQLRALWGTANRKAANQYEQDLSAADPSWATWFKTMASKFDRLR